MPETNEEWNQVGNPGWWLTRLSSQLSSRFSELRNYQAYYDGEHKLAYATDKFRGTFGNLFSGFSDNWTQIVVDACEERLNVEGFRFGENDQGDKEAWAIWQRNQLDADSQIAHTEALVKGSSYVLVWPDADGEPEITIEDAAETIVAMVPGSRRKRAAALKTWVGDDEYISATLYLPDAIYKFRSKEKADTLGLTGITSWDMREVDGEDWPVNNPLKVVPVVPLYNKARLKPEGESEIRNVIPVQDFVNKLVVDMMVASEYSAFRQRWATGLEIPVDPETGQPVQPFKHAVDRLWTSASSETQFGEFSESNLQNYVQAIEMLVVHLAAQTRTPPHYLLGQLVNASGDALETAETGLAMKARRKTRVFGESWEEVMRLAFQVRNDAKADSWNAETIWADTEVKSASAQVDALVKLQALGVPNQQLWQDAGYSPQQIERFRSMTQQQPQEPTQ